MFLQTRQPTMSPMWRTTKEVESEKHARMCTLLAIASVVVVLVLFLPVGCPAYDGGPRTSLASAMHSAVASGSICHASTHFDGDNEALKKYLEENDCTVIVFAHWCGHCKNLLNTVDGIRKSMKHDERTNLVTVDSDQHKEIVQELGIQGFPATFDNKKGPEPPTPVPLNTQAVLTACAGPSFADHLPTPEDAPANKKEAAPAVQEGPSALNW